MLMGRVRDHPLCRSTVPATVILLTLALATASAQVTPPPTSAVPPLMGRPVPAGDATIVGRVIDRDSKDTLAGVFIQLISADLRQVLTARTDGRGQYTFEGIAAGKYRLLATHEGYIDQTHGSPDARMGLAIPEAVVTVDRGAQTRIDFGLVRSGVVGGRVLTEDGRPLKNATITLTMITERGLRVGLRWSAGTNERGEYVVNYVPEGMFQVSAVWTDEGMQPGVNVRQRQIYYPGTESPDRASTLVVSAGLTIRDVDIVLPARELLRIAGQLVAGSSAGPLEAYLLDGQSVERVPVANDGSFSTARLPAGRYTLVARTGGDDPVEATWLTVDLSSELTDLVLGLSPSAVIAGRVVTDDGSPVPVRLEVTAVLAEQGKEIDLLMRDPRDRVVVSEGGRFELRGLFGERVLRVVGDTEGWALERVMLGRTPVTSLKVDPGSRTDDVTIVVTRRGATDRSY